MTNTTIGEGLKWIGIAIAIVGFSYCFFYLLPLSSKDYESDYVKCIKKCPQEGWRDSFSNLECPKMCAELNKESEYTWNICDDEGCLSEKNLSFDKTKDCWFDGCNTHCCNEYGDCTMTLLKCYNKED